MILKISHHDGLTIRNVRIVSFFCVFSCSEVHLFDGYFLSAQKIANDDEEYKNQSVNEERVDRVSNSLGYGPCHDFPILGTIHLADTIGFVPVAKMIVPGVILDSYDGTAIFIVTCIGTGGLAFIPVGVINF